VGTYKAYAGVGNRDTPSDILEEMSNIARGLSKLGYVVRTNGSDVPGNTFESNSDKIELFLPWKNFNKKKSRYATPTDEAFEVAKRYSVVFDTLPRHVQALIACNSNVVLGENLRDPVLFVLCWTPDGVESSKNCTARTGIMSQAIKIADTHGIPVFNLQNTTSRTRLKEFLQKVESK
jgi:hypothetical protein